MNYLNKSNVDIICVYDDFSYCHNFICNKVLSLVVEFFPSLVEVQELSFPFGPSRPVCWANAKRKIFFL